MSWACLFEKVCSSSCRSSACDVSQLATGEDAELTIDKEDGLAGKNVEDGVEDELGVCLLSASFRKSVISFK
jgi:hypothetical protein